MEQLRLPRMLENTVLHQHASQACTADGLSLDAGDIPVHTCGARPASLHSTPVARVHASVNEERLLQLHSGVGRAGACFQSRILPGTMHGPINQILGIWLRLLPVLSPGWPFLEDPHVRDTRPGTAHP